MEAAGSVPLTAAAVPQLVAAHKALLEIPTPGRSAWGGCGRRRHLLGPKRSRGDSQWPMCGKRQAATAAAAALTSAPGSLPLASLAALAGDPLEAEWAVVRGAVSAEELKRLEELRHAVADLQHHPACARVPHDRRPATLLRFLRARGGAVPLAAEMLREAMDWRRDFGLDEKLRAWTAEWEAGTSPRVKLLKAYDFVRLLGRDREGLPVYLHQFGQGDPVGLAREVGQEVLLLHLIRILECNLHEAQSRMLQTGRLVTSFVEVYDLGNYAQTPNWFQRAVLTVPLYKGFAHIFDRVYPERLRSAFLVRCPRAFSMIWHGVSGMLPDATRRKVHVKGFNASSWLEELGAYLPPTCIPAWLRADDQTNFVEAAKIGGLVPRGPSAHASCDGSAFKGRAPEFWDAAADGPRHSLQWPNV